MCNPKRLSKKPKCLLEPSFVPLVEPEVHVDDVMKCDLEVEELFPLEAHPAPVDVQCASILVNRDREWQMWSNDLETKIVKPALARCQGGKGAAVWVARLRLGGPLPCHRSFRLIRLRFLPYSTLL